MEMKQNKLNEDQINKIANIVIEKLLIRFLGVILIAISFFSLIYTIKLMIHGLDSIVLFFSLIGIVVMGIVGINYLMDSE